MVARRGRRWRSPWVSAVMIIGAAQWGVAASAAGTAAYSDQGWLGPALPVSSLLDFATGQSILWCLVALVFLDGAEFKIVI